MRIVALETSTRPGGIALLEQGRLVASHRLATDRRTTESFAVSLDRLLREADWIPKSVDLFAVCSGPGSFTGLRIGITAAKVFSYATGCDVLGVNTLELVARQAFSQDASPAPVWAVLDAQRRQCFAAPFHPDPACVGMMIRQAEDVIVDQASWFQKLPKGTCVTGSGLRRVADEHRQHLRLAPAERWEPCPVELARLAAEHFALGQRSDPWSLVPCYGRQSAAEEKRSAQATPSLDGDS